MFAPFMTTTETFDSLAAAVGCEPGDFSILQDTVRCLSGLGRDVKDDLELAIAIQEADQSSVTPTEEFTEEFTIEFNA